MASGSGSADFFDMSSSSYNDTKMEFYRSSSDTLLKVTVEEETETKEWVLPSSTDSGSVNEVIDGQPVVGDKSFFQEENAVLTVNGNVPIQQDDLCQDDMFSLDELSAVEDHPEQLVVETAGGIADVATSVFGHGYEPDLSSSEVDVTTPGSGARSERGLHETDEEKSEMNIIHGPLDGSGQETDGHFPDIETNNGNSLIEADTWPGQDVIGTSTLEGRVLGNLEFEVVKHPSDVHLANESGEIDNDQQMSEDFEEVDDLTEDFPQNELFKNDTDHLTREVLEEVNVSIEKLPQNESVDNDTDQLTSELPVEVFTSTEEFTKSTVATDDSNEKESKESENNDTDQLTSELPMGVSSTKEFTKSTVATDDSNEKENKECVNNDTDQLTSELPVGVFTSTEEFTKSTVATDDSNEKESKEQTHLTNKVIINSSERGSSEDLPIEARNAANAITCGSELDMKSVSNRHELPAETNDVTNINDYVKDQKEYMQLNLASQSEGLLVQDEDVATKTVVSSELECQSYPKQSQLTLKEHMSLSEEKFLEPSVMKAEVNDSHLKQDETAAMKEDGSQHEQALEMALLKEEEDCNQNQPEKIPCATQITPGNDQNPKGEDVNEVLTTSTKTDESQEMQVCKSGPSAGTDELSVNMMQTEKCLQDTIKQTESMKEEIVSVDINHSCQEEQSQNVKQSENVAESTTKMTSHMSNLEEGTTESLAEDIEDRDGEQKQFELYKGRKVTKIFGKRKFMGEVIGYDPASKWFKVLYEDGDEEELEKPELDAILITLGEKASVSHKRQLSPMDNEHEEPNLSGRKSRKLDTDDTPGQQSKKATSRNETPGSHRSSSTKKGKSNAAKSGGKSKSTRLNARKTQKGKRTATSSKKSIEKKTAKKSQSGQTKKRQKIQIKEKSSKNQVKQESTNQHVDDVTRKLKYGSSTKKSPASTKQKTKENPKKVEEVETPRVLMTTKSEVDSPGRKRKAVSEIQSGLSTVSNKRAKKDKIVNEVESPSEKKKQSRMISEDTPKPEDTPKLQSQAKEDKVESSVPPSTEKRGGSANRGTLLVGRKVKKDFGGKLYGGEIIGYKLFYNVKYEDGDCEDLTWKELESILLPEEDGIVQSKNDEKQSKNDKKQSKTDEKQPGTRHSSVRSTKGKKRN